ncbi:Popeye domain-containing protein 3 [Nymphon striatum]|nr:Popeye domain-containing protein 3 [Nymphon striatum]
MASGPLITEDSIDWKFVNGSNETNSVFPCMKWQQPQHTLFQIANACFCISYLSPSGRFGILVLHSFLILGFLLFSTWAWNIICAPDIFSWNFCFMLINMGQTLYILYTMRKVKFMPELEDAYSTLFKPVQVSRLLFKKLVGIEYGQVVSLHAGEAYAMQDVTRTDRLGLLISGKVNVLTDHQFLHHIHPLQFMDSPEFESCKAGVDDKFKVTIVAATQCKYIFWQRDSLEYLFVKEPYLFTVMSILIARDITTKLYAMNRKIVTEKGSHLDIRLPSITSSTTSGASNPDDIQCSPRSLQTSVFNCESRKDCRKRERKKEKSYEIYNWEELLLTGGLESLYVFELDKYLKKHSLPWKRKLKPEKVAIITAHIHERKGSSLENVIVTGKALLHPIQEPVDSSGDLENNEDILLETYDKGESNAKSSSEETSDGDCKDLNKDQNSRFALQNCARVCKRLPVV